jgi:hypothetical protein
VWGITLGFLFVVVDNMILAMGQFGSLPPFLAAWLPLILFLTIGLWIVFNFEHTGARTYGAFARQVVFRVAWQMRPHKL